MEDERSRTLIETYALEVLTPRCDPNSEGFVAYAHLAADVLEVLPYLNAILPAATYNPAAQAMTWRQGSHHVALHPNQIAVSGLVDRQEAAEEIEAIVRLVNDTWARRAEIEPDHRARQRPGLMEVYRLLPRSNCRACGESTCFAFAGKLLTGGAQLGGCPRLEEPAYAEQHARLAGMAWSLVQGKNAAEVTAAAEAEQAEAGAIPAEPVPDENPAAAGQEGTRSAKPPNREKRAKRKARAAKGKHPNPTPRLSVSKKALRRLRLVAVAYSGVEREFFPTEEAYRAEKEVESRAAEVLGVMEAIGVPGRLYSGGEHFLTDLLADRPDLVLNLVDTLRGRDALQASIPGALELVDIPYTGAGMPGLVLGNDRNLVKQLLKANKIPTPEYQYIKRAGTKVNPALGLPLIVKLNEGGGSVGIDNNAVKETLEAAQEQVEYLIATYRMPVIVERFIDGPEVTAVVFEDRRRRHVFLGQKAFGVRPDGKYEFTSLESYDMPDPYRYVPVSDQELAKRIEQYANKVFKILHSKDYAKYDIRVEAQTGTPYFTDCNPNTAFGPSLGLPFTEIVETLYGVKFQRVLEALLSKYAKKMRAAERSAAAGEGDAIHMPPLQETTRTAAGQ